MVEKLHNVNLKLMPPRDKAAIFVEAVQAVNQGKTVMSGLTRALEQEVNGGGNLIFVTLNDNLLNEEIISPFGILDRISESQLQIIQQTNIFEHYLGIFGGVASKALYASLGHYLRQRGQNVVVIAQAHTKHLSYMNHKITRDSGNSVENGNYLSKIPLVLLRNKLK